MPIIDQRLQALERRTANTSTIVVVKRGEIGEQASNRMGVDRPVENVPVKDYATEPTNPGA